MKLYPIATEKAIRMLEAENKLTFVVEGKFTKKEVREQIQRMFNANVSEVNKLTDRRSGKSRVYVKFSGDVSAVDIATKLGLM